MRQSRRAFLCASSFLLIMVIAHVGDLRHPHSIPQPYQLAMSADRGTTLGAAPGSLPSVRLSDSYGKIPISFEANQGQADERVPFLARGAGYNVYLTSSEVVLVLRRSHGTG